MALGRLIQALHDAAQAEDVGGFRREALTRLRACVPFRFAIWGEATVSDRLQLLEPQLLGLEPSQLPDVEQAATLDPRLNLVLGSPGRAHAYSIAPTDPDALRTVCARIGVGHVMSIANFQPIAGVASGIVLVRSADQPPFETADREFVEAAFPHLVSGWTNSQIHGLLVAAGLAPRRPLYAAAVREGCLVAAEPGFLDMLREEWPHWSGPVLPADVMRATGAYLGERVRVELLVADQPGLLLATARARMDADRLTPRQLEVARLRAAGKDYRTIAAALGVAPATARNHIAAIHATLNVQKNSEIGMLLTEAGLL
jgi:DNA-binding CsgD family transcriptional regulator